MESSNNLEIKHLKEVPTRGGGIPPGNITVRSKSIGGVNEVIDGERNVWVEEEDDDVSTLTAGTKKKRVLRDLGNQVNCENGAALLGDDTKNKRVLSDLSNQVSKTKKDGA